MFLSFDTLAQSYRVTKIIETNKFELENGQKVKIYGLFTPSIKDTNPATKAIAKKIVQWESDNLLLAECDFTFVADLDNGFKEAIINKSLAFSVDDLASYLLYMGFAKLDTAVEKQYYEEQIDFQISAMNKKMGIWSDVSTSTDIILNTSQGSHTIPSLSLAKSSTPLLPLLALGIASFALSWDSFAEADQLATSIDNLKKLNSKDNTIKNSISDYESQRTRKYVVGASFLIAGILTTILSFKDIQLNPGFNSLAVRYKF
jgi:hypothetical protein